MVTDERATFGLRCPCHGVRLFDTAAERDAAAITYQCNAQFFRLRADGGDAEK